MFEVYYKYTLDYQNVDMAYSLLFTWIIINVIKHITGDLPHLEQVYSSFYCHTSISSLTQYTYSTLS